MSDEEFREAILRHLVGLLSAFAQKYFGRRIRMEDVLALFREAHT